MEMNNRDEMEVNLEILRKENQEIKLLLEQERTLRNKLEVEGAKRMEATLKAYRERVAELVKHHVKVKAQKIEHNVLRVNNEDLNMKYGMLQRTHKKVEAEMAALRKENQELKQLKEPCVEENAGEMASLRERNQELKQLKEHCVEEEAKMAALQKTNQELQQQKERCLEKKSVEKAALRERNQELQLQTERDVEEKSVEKAALRQRNQELKQLKEHCVEEVAALLKENQTLKQEKLRCVEEKDAEIVVLHERNHELEQQKERCVEEKDAEIVTLLESIRELQQLKERCVQEIAALKTSRWRKFMNFLSRIGSDVPDDDREGSLDIFLGQLPPFSNSVIGWSSIGSIIRSSSRKEAKEEAGCQ
ncbi:trichohyalin-like [Pseudochaenichthys georgianus]|uniref:trichohyalin-like n=1 Tax=Pseudochaenichthys georgianus TaxID=52239 RepID=UPI00146C4154|nr:trichohyalin-like isoform X1 [Pseudochaenichthys georgianus]